MNLQEIESMVGYGYDLHKIVAGKGLTLGGIVIKCDLATVAHSDGDVVLHALVDALLGSVGLGDIGDHFPDTDPQWRDADSKQFVLHAIGLLRKKGVSIVNVDVVIILERPKLGPYKIQMKEIIADLCGVSADKVNVKATTNEGIGHIGRGEGVCAHVICQVQD